MKKFRANLVLVYLSAFFSVNAMALTVAELEQGLNDALNFSAANSAMAIYVNGYVTGSANFAQTIGLLCVDGNKTSSLDLLRKVKEYIRKNPEVRSEGAQLIINRALVGEKC